MTESPDVPWAKSQDHRIKKPFREPPSRAALFFFEFLKSKGISGGRMVDLGCGNGRNAIYFAKNGFEVHAVDKSDELLKDMDLHGVMPHCHSVTEYWLFEDAFFDFAIDIFCYSEQSEDEKKKFYRSELSRVLRPGSYYLLSVPMEEGVKEKIEKEFGPLRILASEESEDKLAGKKVRTLNLILGPA